MTKVPHMYLDYNASAPARPAAMEAAREAMALAANPSSVHGPGRKARALIESARESVAALAGASSANVVFTGGGTEANALAILGAAEGGLAQRLIVSAIEHDSVLETAKLAARRCGIALDIVRVTSEGVVDLDELEKLLSLPVYGGSGRAAAEGGHEIAPSVAFGDTSPINGGGNGAIAGTLISVMAANNETGVIQPLVEIAALARKHGALLHTDAVQIAGRLPFDAAPFDLISLSAHKLGGIAGAGALIARDGIALAPLWGGGRQESGLRPGTEPLAAIAAFGAAAREAAKDLARAETHARWRDAMEARLTRAVPDLRVFGVGSPRLPQTSCLGLPGTLAETQVIALDLAGFAVSAGAACSSGKVRKSHVLEAMGAGEAEARSAIRVSFGFATREEELHQFADVWARQLKRSLEITSGRHPGRDAARSAASQIRDRDLDPHLASLETAQHRSAVQCARDDSETVKVSV